MPSKRKSPKKCVLRIAGSKKITKVPQNIRASRKPIIKQSFDDLCRILPSLKNAIGSGSYGTVYRYCSLSKGGKKICDYVIKIEDKCSRRIGNVVSSSRINNKLYSKDPSIAARIYKIKLCGNKCVSLMDYVRGTPVSSVIARGGFNANYAQRLMKSIDRMHKLLGHGHGDLGFGNIIDNGSKFVFIDFGPENHNRPSAFDYGTWLWYMANKAPIIKYDVILLIYQKIYRELQPYSRYFPKIMQMLRDYMGMLLKVQRNMSIDRRLMQRIENKMKEESVPLFFNV